VSKPIQSRKAVDEVLEEAATYAKRQERRLLLVEPDPVRLTTIREYLSGMENVEMICATDGPRARRAHAERRDRLRDRESRDPGSQPPRGDGGAARRATAPPPVIAYGREPAASVGSAVAHPAIPGVREIHSIERLLDQTVLALHIEEPRLKETHRKVLEDIHSSTKALAGRSVLIVDDDIRNIFALVVGARGLRDADHHGGQRPDAINIADKRELDVILMDIMMPELDGLDTMREIRKIPRCKDLPIVAVTAKAMKGDRERCIEAGAWDYLSKPVDREQLLKVLRAWLR
jgi:CheY-like chemotaxis protein